MRKHLLQQFSFSHSSYLFFTRVDCTSPFNNCHYKAQTEQNTTLAFILFNKLLNGHKHFKVSASVHCTFRDTEPHSEFTVFCICSTLPHCNTSVQMHLITIAPGRNRGKKKKVSKNDGYTLCSILMINLCVGNWVSQDTFVTISLLLLCSPSLSYLVQ